MFLFIIIILIILVAFTLYRHIEFKLPKNFRFLHPSTALTHSSSTQDSAADYGHVLPQAAPGYWLVSVYGANSRAVRAFRSSIRAPGETYAPPFLYFSCYQGVLYSWLDTRLRAASTPAHHNAVAISVDGAAPQLWERRQGAVLIAPDPAKLLRLAEQTPKLTIRLTFDDAPRQTLTLLLKNARPLTEAMTSCSG